MLTRLTVYGEHTFFRDLANHFGELSERAYHQVDTQTEDVVEAISDLIKWEIKTQLFEDVGE